MEVLLEPRFAGRSVRGRRERSIDLRESEANLAAHVNGRSYGARVPDRTAEYACFQCELLLRVRYRRRQEDGNRQDRKQHCFSTHPNLL
jgi:hypothetical protein